MKIQINKQNGNFLCGIVGDKKKYHLTEQEGRFLKTEKILQRIFYVPKILK